MFLAYIFGFGTLDSDVPQALLLFPDIMLIHVYAISESYSVKFMGTLFPINNNNWILLVV